MAVPHISGSLPPPNPVGKRVPPCFARRLLRTVGCRSETFLQTCKTPVQQTTDVAVTVSRLFLRFGDWAKARGPTGYSPTWDCGKRHQLRNLNYNPSSSHDPLLGQFVHLETGGPRKQRRVLCFVLTLTVLVLTLHVAVVTTDGPHFTQRRK